MFSQSIVDPLGEESKDTYIAPLAIYIVCHACLQYAVTLVVQYNIHLSTGVWFSLCVCAASMCLQVGGCRGSVPGCRRAGLPPATPPTACLQGVRGLQRDGWWGFSTCACYALRTLALSLCGASVSVHGYPKHLILFVAWNFILPCSWITEPVSMWVLAQTEFSTGSPLLLLHPLQARSCIAWQKRLWSSSKG